MRWILAFLISASWALAQVPVGPVPTPHIQFLSATGDPLVAGKVCTYAAGTSTPLATYKDYTGTVANAVCTPSIGSGIVLDAGGFADIWLVDGVYYKMAVYNSAKALQWTVDGISSPLRSVMGLVRYRGTYNGATTYVTNDLVVYGGDSYVSLTTQTGVVPSPGANWDQISRYPPIATDAAVGLVKSITCGAGQAITSFGSGTGIPVCGAVGSPTNFVDNETPTGNINGINTAFTLAHTPTSGSETCHLNGLAQRSGAGNDYTISAANITYLSAPLTGSTLVCSYRY